MKKFFVFLLFLSIFFNKKCYAKITNAQQCNPGVINKINSYLSSFNNLKADFNQIDRKGKNSNGIFYMKKPNKMKLRYINPNLVILYDKSTLLYHDVELNSVKKHKINNFMLRAILEGRINGRNLQCLDIIENEKGITVHSLANYDITHSSNFTFYFSKSPNLSLKMIESSSKSEYFKINFNNLNYSQISDHYFNIN